MDQEPRSRTYSVADIVGATPIGIISEDDEQEELQRFYDRVGQNHIPCWEDIVGGRVVFLPGSDVRAKMISKFFSNTEVHGAERGIRAYTGTIDDIPVMTIASGMGSGQLEIIGTEVMRAMLNKGGAVIRYGSMGALKPVPIVKVADLLIAEWALGADSSFAWMTDEQIKGGARIETDISVIMSLQNALFEAGYSRSPRRGDSPVFHSGGIQSKALLYAQEIGVGPRGKYFERIKKIYEQIPDLYGSEMETALLYTIAARLNYLTEKYEGRRPILAGSINFFIGDSDHPFHPDAKVRRSAEKGLVKTVPYVARHMYNLVKEIPQLK
ncbi:MAG: hypothetical protein WC254_02370 [Candidatus Woesearchaeota archaeon]|jgi:uridine phosphorylase